MPFTWTVNNFIFLRNYKKWIIIIIKKQRIPAFAPVKIPLYTVHCANVHSLVWFPQPQLFIKKTKISTACKTKLMIAFAWKVVWVFLSFFRFSGLIRILSLINLQRFFCCKKINSAQKAVCDFFTPHLLTLGWLNFCRWSSLCCPYLQAGFDWAKNNEYQPTTRLDKGA